MQLLNSKQVVSICVSFMITIELLFVWPIFPVLKGQNKQFV